MTPTILWIGVLLIAIVALAVALVSRWPWKARYQHLASNLAQVTRLQADVARRAEMRAQRAEEVSDRLAAIVQEYVDITRTYAQQTKDPSPPPMKAEHDALQIYAEAKKSRPLQLYGNEPTGRTEPPSPNPRPSTDHRGESRAG